MTANGRPNLGGLFTGSTPPDRSSTIADVLDPGAGGAASGHAAGRSAASRAAGRSQTPPSTASTHTARDGASAAWWDPVNVLGHYFDLLQGVFDANRAFTMAVATAVTAPLRRTGGGR